MPRLSRSDVGLLVFRLGFAGLLVGFHGWSRFLKAYHFTMGQAPWPFVSTVERLGFPFPAVFGVLSALSESVAALFIGAGLFTRAAGAILAINMAVAVANEWAGHDSIELPALYLLGAVVIAVLGPGAISADGLRRRN